MEQVRAVDRVIRELVLLDLAGESVAKHIDRLAVKHSVHVDYVTDAVEMFREVKTND